MARGKHPKAAIEMALQYAEARGWTVRKAGKSAHAWGVLECPNNDPECRCGKFCRNGIWSTPRNTEAHARAIIKWVEKCKYTGGGE